VIPEILAMKLTKIAAAASQGRRKPQECDRPPPINRMVIFNASG